MRKLTILGSTIFYMTENDAYPSPDYDAAESFCVWHDEEGQYWLDIYYKSEWHRAFLEPFSTFEDVFEAIQKYSFDTPPKQ